jgi:hypothetical protein
MKRQLCHAGILMFIMQELWWFFAEVQTFVPSLSYVPFQGFA